MFTVRQTDEFVAWFDDLKNNRAQVRIAAFLRQAEAGSLVARALGVKFISEPV